VDYLYVELPCLTGTVVIRAPRIYTHTPPLTTQVDPGGPLIHQQPPRPRPFLQIFQATHLYLGVELPWFRHPVLFHEPPALVAAAAAASGMHSEGLLWLTDSEGAFENPAVAKQLKLARSLARGIIDVQVPCACPLAHRVLQRLACKQRSRRAWQSCVFVCWLGSWAHCGSRQTQRSPSPLDLTMTLNSTTQTRRVSN
jgi:hypothetical protein